MIDGRKQIADMQSELINSTLDRINQMFVKNQQVVHSINKLPLEIISQR